MNVYKRCIAGKTTVISAFLWCSVHLVMGAPRSRIQHVADLYREACILEGQTMVRYKSARSAAEMKDLYRAWMEIREHQSVLARTFYVEFDQKLPRVWNRFAEAIDTDTLLDRLHRFDQKVQSLVRDGDLEAAVMEPPQDAEISTDEIEASAR